MILSGTSIKEAVQNGDFIIEPFAVGQIKGASYTFTLGSPLLFLEQVPELSVGMKPSYKEELIPPEGFLLQPGQFVLARTKEKVSLNKKYTCTLSSRGSCAQIGLEVLLGSTFAEPDTDSMLILEIANLSGMPIRLHEGMKIVKGVFTEIT